MKKISICIPVVRVEKSLECIAAIHENAGIEKNRYEIVTSIDTERIGCPRMLKKLVERSKHDLICFLGDDTLPEKDFLKNALRAMASLPDGWGVVGFNTNPGNDHAHFLADRRILEHIPGGDFFSTEFEHCFGDDELKDIAVEQGRWVYAKDALLEHVHPINKSAEYDEHYQRAYDKGRFERDQATYFRRRMKRTVERSGPQLAIGFPLTDQKVYTNFFFSFLRLEKPYQFVILMPDFPGHHDAVRNNLVKQALQSNCSHILMMDTDQIYVDPDLISRMMSHKRPVVGARVHRRYPPFDPLCFRGPDPVRLEVIPDAEIELAMNNGNPLVEVDATGCGCVLYDLSIFTHIPEPWFEETKDEKGMPIGEDIGFCFKLKDHGYKIAVDCSLNIQHLTLHATDWGTYKTWQKIHGALEEGAQQNP